MTNTVLANGGGPPPLTLLGQGPARISTAGKIRAGIKVLTRKAAEYPQAKEIYEQGLAAGQSFEQIEQTLGAALPHLRAPLVPKNVAWFTLRGQDFPNPEMARQILDACGEDRGDGVKRLYRFPVVFPSDIWQVVMPHELVAWGASEKKFWSEYAGNGQARHCKCYAPATSNDSGRRVIRVFGGRKTMLRNENGGLCEPESCAEYQQRQCNLSGYFIFFIPGIKSISAFELHTNSFYAMQGAIQKFETIAFMRGGRISGFLDDHQTPFYITKKLRDVAHVDENGRAVRVSQWIIELEAPIDVSALLRDQGDAQTPILQAQFASEVLEGPAGIERVNHASPIEPEVEPAVDPLINEIWREGCDAVADGVVDEVGDVVGNEVGEAVDDDVGTTDARQHVVTARIDRTAPDTPKNGRHRPSVKGNPGPSLEQVIETARSCGIEAERYEQYADRRWGSGWKLNAHGRCGALEELERHRNDPQALRDKIDAA